VDDEYAEGKHRRFGTANPELMPYPFWKAMVRSGATAYAGRATFDDTFGSFDDSDQKATPRGGSVDTKRFMMPLTLSLP
jgi:hypothetical protein